MALAAFLFPPLAEADPFADRLDDPTVRVICNPKEGKPGSGSGFVVGDGDHVVTSKLADARGYLGNLGGRLTVIDEVQRIPGLFQVLRGLIDERIRAGEPSGHFLLLGSASIDLLRQSSESLAGRIAYLELAPFDPLEVAPPGESQPLSQSP